MSKLTRGRKLFIGVFGTIGLVMIGSGVYMTKLPEENEWKDKGGPMIAVGSLFVFLSIIMWMNPMVPLYGTYIPPYYAPPYAPHYASPYAPVYPPAYAPAYPPAYAPFYPHAPVN